jgi:hypothetical protein
MATLFHGHHKLVKKLAETLAPGRAVRRITLDFPARGLCTATVEVMLDEKDLPLIQELAEDVHPDQITFVEGKGPQA